VTDSHVADGLRLLCAAGFGELAPIIELHPAVTTMIEFASRYAGEKVPNPVLHPVDPIAHLQLDQSGGSTPGTTALIAHAVGKTRNELLLRAAGTAVDRKVFEALPRTPGSSLHHSTAQPTFPHIQH
jgi:hypothetical protein